MLSYHLTWEMYLNQSQQIQNPLIAKFISADVEPYDELGLE